MLERIPQGANTSNTVLAEGRRKAITKANGESKVKVIAFQIPSNRLAGVQGLGEAALSGFPVVNEDACPFLLTYLVSIPSSQIYHGPDRYFTCPPCQGSACWPSRFLPPLSGCELPGPCHSWCWESG